MAVVTGPNSVTLSTSGNSDSVQMGRGEWDLDLYATSWDSGNPAVVQFAKVDEDARYVTITDPATSVAISRVANGQTIRLKHGGGFLRIRAATIGTTSGLGMRVDYVGSGD